MHYLHYQNIVFFRSCKTDANDTYTAVGEKKNVIFLFWSQCQWEFRFALFSIINFFVCGFIFVLIYFGVWLLSREWVSNAVFLRHILSFVWFLSKNLSLCIHNVGVHIYIYSNGKRINKRNWQRRKVWNLWHLCHCKQTQPGNREEYDIYVALYPYR